MIRNDVKYVDFLSSGVKPEWGIVLWFQSDIPLKIIIEFVQPHLTITTYPTFSIPNDRRPDLSWIKVACALQKLDQLFQGKTLQTVFFTKISPARSSKEKSNTLWSLRLQTLITSTFVSNKFCLDICSLRKHNHTMDPKIWNCKARDFTILSGYLQFAYN